MSREKKSGNDLQVKNPPHHCYGPLQHATILLIRNDIFHA